MAVSRLKAKITHMMGKKKSAKAVAIKQVRPKQVKSPRTKAGEPAVFPVEVTHKEMLGVQETVVEQSKFSTPVPARYRRGMPHELPYGYGKDKIVAQTRDPWWLHTYWEVLVETYERLKRQLGNAFHSAKRALRVYDVTNVKFDGTNANRYFDVEIHHDATSWYVDTGGPGRAWCIDYGLKLANGEFITIVRSNIVGTPLDGPSSITDEEWAVPEELFARLYGLGFGLGQSSPVGKAWQERVKRQLYSGVFASPGMGSGASPVKDKRRIPGERSFWLVVNTELIVYGATEPDAKVTVQGKDIALRPDGTFSLRFALPDGTQVIPVHATSSDGIDEREITPVVTKETR